MTALPAACTVPWHLPPAPLDPAPPRPPGAVPQALAVLGRTVVVKDDKIRRELGFQNVVSLEEGLAGVRAAQR